MKCFETMKKILDFKKISLNTTSDKQSVLLYRGDNMRKTTIGIVILSIIMIGMVIPAGFSGEANSVVITYGETTHANSNYKADVDSFFKSQNS